MPPSLSRTPETTPAHARARLLRLQGERLMAADAGVDPASAYIAHLEAAIAGARTDLVTRSVVEIAGLRAAFDGPLEG
jgi:hypothetical protein